MVRNLNCIVSKNIFLTKNQENYGRDLEEKNMESK